MDVTCGEEIQENGIFIGKDVLVEPVQEGIDRGKGADADAVGQFGKGNGEGADAGHRG